MDILLKRSNTPSAVPSTASLELGEIAVNTYDGRLFLKKDDGVETVIAVGERTPLQLLEDIKTVDGAGSGLDADTLDGIGADGFASSGANDDITSLTTITGGIATPQYIDFDTTNTVTAARGRLWYNAEDDTLNLAHDNDVVQQIGQEFFLPPCINNSGVTIENGMLVRVTGVQGDKLTIARAVTDGSIDPHFIVGVATHEILNTAEGALVVKDGIVRDVDTSAWPVGTVLYSNPAVPGALTSTKPAAPAIRTAIAIVLRQHATTGRIYVRMEVGSTLGESDTNVQFGTLANTDLIVYNSANSRWENVQPSTITVGNSTQLAGEAASFYLDYDNFTNTPQIGVDVQAYDANTAFTDIAQTFTAPQRGVITTDNDLSFNLSVTNNFKCTPSAPGTLAFTNIPTDGQGGYIVLDNSGGHAISASSEVKTSSTLLSTISSTGLYLLSYFSDGTNVYVVSSNALS